jgi:class 3 adenylate cyclase
VRAARRRERRDVPLGPRKKLLKAIAALSAERSSASPATGAEAERRQLTVLFCDLVGSTELSGRLDPEDLSEVMRAYQGCCAEVIGRFSGYVAKYLGDGVLAYFGYPQAHEDDAERAVRAGLGLVAAVTQLRPGGDLALQVRVGIASGLVVVGEKIGTGAAQEETVVGETPNLAARLQAEAGPNSVVIATSTRRLLGGAARALRRVCSRRSTAGSPGPRPADSRCQKLRQLRCSKFSAPTEQEKQS